MGAPVRLCSSLASGANSASTRIRLAERPYLIQAKDGYTGNVSIQNSTDGYSVSDASATWADVVTGVASGGTYTIDHPVTRLRVVGGHSAGSATVDLIEGC